MSVIGKKPFVETVIETLSSNELETLKTRIDNLGTIYEYSILPCYGNVLTSAAKGIKAARIRLTVSECATGILVYNDSYCVLFSWSCEKEGRLGIIKINSSLDGYEVIDENLTIEELRRTVKDASSGSGGTQLYYHYVTATGVSDILTFYCVTTYGNYMTTNTFFDLARAGKIVSYGYGDDENRLVLGVLGDSLGIIFYSNDDNAVSTTTVYNVVTDSFEEL